MIQDIAKIVCVCCEYFGISEEMVCSKSKKGDVSDLRKKILCYLHDQLHISYRILSKVFNRNPRTVRRAIEDTRHRLTYERLFRLEYEQFLYIAKGATN
jgi:chromosomal replication initiation ATPase DnaA